MTTFALTARMANVFDRWKSSALLVAFRPRNEETPTSNRLASRFPLVWLNQVLVGRISSFAAQTRSEDLKRLIYVGLTDEEYRQLEPLDAHVATLVETSLKSAAQPIWTSDGHGESRRILLITYSQSAPMSFSINSSALVRSSAAELRASIDRTIEKGLAEKRETAKAA